MMSFGHTWQLLRMDIARRRQLDGRPSTVLGTLATLLQRGCVTVVCYRLSRFCVLNSLRPLHRPLGWLAYLCAHNEVSPLADLGGGLVIADAGGVGIPGYAIAGRNCTFLGRNSLTLGAMEGFDIERDRIILGDHCVLGNGARIMRPVELAAGTQVLPNSVAVMRVEKVGATIVGIPAKRRRLDPYEEVIQWNPLQGGFIQERQ